MYLNDPRLEKEERRNGEFKVVKEKKALLLS